MTESDTPKMRDADVPLQDRIPMATELRDHGSFATIRYYIPSKKARGFWHGHHSADRAVWGWCQLSACKTFWETSRMTGQFDTEDEAVADANKRQ